MSSYYSKAKRPNGTEFEDVEMLDNYYVRHQYGVRFSDGATFREEDCEFADQKKELKCPRCGKLNDDNWLLTIDGNIRKGGCQDCWEEECDKSLNEQLGCKTPTPKDWIEEEEKYTCGICGKYFIGREEKENFISHCEEHTRHIKKLIEDIKKQFSEEHNCSMTPLFNIDEWLEGKIIKILQDNTFPLHSFVKSSLTQQKEAIEKENKINENTSDGYHTFKELYEHRITLFIALCKSLKNGNVWRAKLHSDGSSFDGWFILGIWFEKGEQITYHLPLKKWDETDFAQTLEKAPDWDGHTSNDVLERIKKLD